MAQNVTNCVSVQGTIVEIVEQGERPTARISVDTFHLDIPADGIPDAHLGDPVVLTLGLKVVGIRNGISHRIND